MVKNYLIQKIGVIKKRLKHSLRSIKETEWTVKNIRRNIQFTWYVSLDFTYFLIKKIAKKTQDAYEKFNEKEPSVYGRIVGSTSKTMFRLVAGFLCLFLVWGSFFEINEVIHTSGEVEPENDIKIVNHLEGGLIDTILVKEGDIVNAGQILMTIKDSIASANLDESRRNYYDNLAQVQRLNAQIKSIPLDLSDAIKKNFPDIYNETIEKHTIFTDNLKGEENIIKSQREQNISNLSELEKRLGHLKDIYNTAAKKYERMDTLLSKGLVVKTQHDQAASDKDGRKMELDSAVINIEKAKASIAESEARLKNVKDRYEMQDLQYIKEHETKLQEAKKIVKVLEERVARTDIRAPVRGVIQQLFVNTKGSSVPAGKDMMTIVPTQENLRVIAHANPADIGFLKVGQEVSVKVNAFDYSLFGALSGKITKISADTFKSQGPQGPQQPFYRLYIHVEKDFLERNGQKYPIKPGMTINADINTGKRTVMHYLLKPIRKTLDTSLSER
jgi:adhesin transport system membrane fusion protein